MDDASKLEIHPIFKICARVLFVVFTISMSAGMLAIAYGFWQRAMTP